MSSCKEVVTVHLLCFVVACPSLLCQVALELVIPEEAAHKHIHFADESQKDTIINISGKAGFFYVLKHSHGMKGEQEVMIEGGG